MEETRKVDLSYLQRFSQGNNASILKYINMFLNSAPALLHNAEVAVGSSDAQSLYTALHTLKPQLQFMGIISAFAQTGKTIITLHEKSFVTEEIKQSVNSICLEVRAAITELEVLKTQF